MKIVDKLKEIIKDIRYFFNIEKLDINDIPPMRYPKGENDEQRKNFVNPFAKYNSWNSRIRYRGRR